MPSIGHRRKHRKFVSDAAKTIKNELIMKKKRKKAQQMKKKLRLAATIIYSDRTLRQRPSTVTTAATTSAFIHHRKHSSLNYFPFHALPLHLQKRIFQYLPMRCRVRLERVSIMWKRLLDGCWENFTQADIPATVTDSFDIRPIDDKHVCGFLRKCGRYLRNIDFFFPHFHIGEHVLCSISQRCSNLRQLRLMTDVNGVAMTSLLKAYSHQLCQLQSLSISYQAEDGLQNGLRAVARAMTSLEMFRLDCYTMPPSVGALFPNSQHMRLYSLLLRQPPAPSRIDQTRWKWVTAEYVHEFLAYLADMYPLLEELDLSLDTSYRVDEDIVQRHLRKIGSERPIKRLNLRLSCLFEDYDVWFGARALQALETWQQLTQLSLWTCQLPNNFLTILGSTGLGSRLTKLRLSIVRSLSHDFLCELFRLCPNLEAFSLIYSVDDHFHCPRSITVDTIETICMHCRRLSEIELMDCDHVDLALVIPCLHRYMHDANGNNRSTMTTSTTANRSCSSFVTSPPSAVIELSYKTRLNLRLRNLIRVASCCTEIMRRRDDLYTVCVYRQCNREKDITD